MRARSFVSAISCDLKLLSYTTIPPVPVDWSKQQVLATSNEELAVERLRSTLLSLDKINANRAPSAAEQELADTDHPGDYLQARGARLIVVCEAADMAMENAPKALAVLSGVEAKTLWTHGVGEVVASLDDDDAEALRTLMASAPELVKSPAYITMWRPVGVYGTPGEGMTVYEVATPAFATAIGLMACKAAAHVVAAAASRCIARHEVSDKVRRRAAALQDHLTRYDIGTGEPAG